jgi:hypothetical protein
MGSKPTPNDASDVKRNRVSAGFTPPILFGDHSQNLQVLWVIEIESRVTFQPNAKQVVGVPARSDKAWEYRVARVIFCCEDED